MVLFFEIYSIVQTLFLIKYIKKAKLIYFHKKLFPPIIWNPWIKKIVEGLIRLFNNEVMIETPPAEKISEHNWMMNKKAVDVVENLTDDIKSSAIYKTILNIIKDDNILKFYKMKLVNDMSTRLLFFKIAEDLVEEYKGSVYIIPAVNSDSEFQKEIIAEKVLKEYILPNSFKANQLRSFFRKGYKLVIFALLPSIYIFLNLKRITFKKINLKSYNIAMPFIWGFHEGNVVISGVKWKHDDSYLYNEDVAPDRIVYIFNFWRNSSDIEEGYKKIMDKKGIHYADRNNYKISATLIRTAAKIQILILQHFLINLFYKNEKYDYIWYSSLTIFLMLNKYLEFENVDYKVELMRHDYNPGHIVETILCNQKNRKTVGIQHGSTAGPYVLNMLCYIHFDKYCIFSDRHRELYSPFWNKINLEKVGNYRIDDLIKMSNDKSVLTSIKNRINSLYGNRKYICLILFPTLSEYNLMEKWNEIYEALRELKSINIDCNIFLRFRNVGDLENSHLKRFKTLSEIDNRFIIDLTNFSSYELMVVSDLVITGCHSSAIIDAISIRKPAFTFDYMGTAKYCFSKYGKDIILTKKSQFLDVFRNLNNNFEKYDCDWDNFRKDYNYYYDGKCLERLQRVVLQTVEELNDDKNKA